MNINATLLGQMITFAVFVWFTMRFVWPLLMQAIEERQAKIADGLAAAEKGRHELELAEVRAKELLRERKQQAAEIVAHAQKRANEIIEEAKISARTESERILGSARAQISQDLQEARDKLQREVGQLAIAAAEQILMREVDAEAHQEIVNKLSVQL
ncbi:MAG TPA: F0F1 ATP synthase subunit B [Gammaproteobacteria bacterium]|nr:F0F1 ATP synthase subunit B [Gammaproteobacteria bacterium]HEX2245797.1 F0F1 ATP synthase subunit B [Gammaproteobacteria bacterium]